LRRGERYGRYIADGRKARWSIAFMPYAAGVSPIHVQGDAVDPPVLAGYGNLALYGMRFASVKRHSRPVGADQIAGYRRDDGHDSKNRER
jgi:hypothetical protein